MRKFMFVLATCLMFVLVYVGIVVNVASTEPQCQVPNLSTTPCYSPDDRVLTCTGMEYFECGAVSAVAFVYEITDMPDGTIKTATGVTKGEDFNCWRRKGCVWNYTTNMCETSAIWSAWRIKSRVVVDNDKTCPLE
ncbi:MAG: hypothetical protein LBC74_08310 [Planctomycetaceae bacterium]|jgi:hypothetical protein|nr:hypothetical protein [Planctomycetaceae bacterium]